MNLRGVKESVTAIAPIFGLFIVTHAVLLIAVVAGNITKARTSRERYGPTSARASDSDWGVVGVLTSSCAYCRAAVRTRASRPCRTASASCERVARGDGKTDDGPHGQLARDNGRRHSSDGSSTPRLPRARR